MALLRSLLCSAYTFVHHCVVICRNTWCIGIAFQSRLPLHRADPSVVLYGFIFLVALGIDYNIFLMTRVREESIKSGTRKGVLID